MIRELVFSWEAWVIWYMTAGITYTVISNRKRKAESKKAALPGWQIATPLEPEQDQPKSAPNLVSMNYEGQENVFDIRSKPEKPDWMR